jgi:predicted O-methyltransferase YrrM
MAAPMSGPAKALYDLAGRSALVRFGLLWPFYFARFLYFAIKERSLAFYRYYPGHHGSTIPSWKQVVADQQRIFSADGAPDGIDLDAPGQLALLDAFSAYYGDFRPPEREAPGRSYHFRNPMYGFNDGFVLYAFLRHFRPKQVVEVGSGYSSALMLDTCADHQPECALTFIDPYSTTIAGVLARAPGARGALIRQPVQDVDLEAFRRLGENDILFIDSSHVVKIGSDLSSLLFQVLPALKPGVIVHIHDIWYPWTYPRPMVEKGCTYNEAWFVRAFLQYNRAFKVLFFTSFLEARHPERFAQLPGYLGHGGGASLWLKRQA